MKCLACNKEVMPTQGKKERLPPGWKRKEEAIYCKGCWRSRYKLRAITFPVAGPVDASWEELRAALSTAWAQSTGLSNWATTELAKADVTRKPGDAKMPAVPKVYLYPEARRQYPEMPPQSVTAVLHAVEAKYREKRYEIVWTHAASLPSYRYPVPFPVHNQGWKGEWQETTGTDGQTCRVPTVSFRIGDKRWTVRLRGGPHFHRQKQAFEQIVSGEAVQGELAVYRQRANGNDNRIGMKDREPGGRANVSYRIMVKLVAWMPRGEQRTGLRGKLLLRRSSAHYWIAEVVGREPWILNADHVRRWCAQHRKYVRRMAEDLKQEKRWPAKMRAQMQDALDRKTTKYKRRMQSWCHQASAALAQFARRQGVERVVYDDADRGYLESFQWYMQDAMLANSLDEFGIVLEAAPASAEDVETPNSEESTQTATTNGSASESSNRASR